MKKAFIRLAVTVFATVNAILTAKGSNPIPLDESLLTEWLSYAFDFGMLVWAWWKDAPITKAAQEAHAWMKAIKEDGILEGDDAEC